MKIVKIIIILLIMASCTPIRQSSNADVFKEAEAYFDSLDARRVSIEDLILINKTFYYGRTNETDGSEACKSNSQREGR